MVTLGLLMQVEHAAESAREDHELMGLALDEAALALAEREVPVGCVFAVPASAAAPRRVLARAHNRTNALYSPLAHAEMVALDALVAALPALPPGCSDPLPALRSALAAATLLVTVEPCLMCADALARAGVQRVVYGCPNDKFGGCGTVADVFCGSTAAAAAGAAGGRSVASGVRAGEAVALLKRFYARSNERAAAAGRGEGGGGGGGGGAGTEQPPAQ